MPVPLQIKPAHIFAYPLCPKYGLYLYKASQQKTEAKMKMKEGKETPLKTKILTDWSLTEKIGLPLHCTIYSNQENSLENFTVP